MRKLEWLAIALVTAAGLSAGTAMAAGDPAEGQKVFNRVCAACHTTTADGPKRLGPPLDHGVGRKAGSIDGFRYSQAHKSSGLTWTPQTLDAYLKDPKAKVPGTIMAFAGLKKDDERENVISYLETLK